MAASEFKAKCLGLMDEVEATGRSVFITKRGKLIAQLAPIVEASFRKKSIFGRLRPLGVLHGDIVASEFTDEEWDRMAGEKQARVEKEPS
jgi:prevent-host-death family protein